MTDRRGDQGFAVVTQSVTGRGRGRGPNRIRGLGVVVVLAVAVALVGVGWLGPRLNATPNFDISYFATPSPSPTPTPTFPNRAEPLVTPLPVLTQAEGVSLDGRIAIVTDAIRSLDLRTGTTSILLPIELWRDAIFRTSGDSYACICIEEQFEENTAVRLVTWVDIEGDRVTRHELVRLVSRARQPLNQPDPMIDVDLVADHRSGLMATATRFADEWRIGVRPIDRAHGAPHEETALGRVVLPAISPTPSPSPTPDAGFAPGEDVYLDGPHIRLAPDGQSAFVWTSAQRYYPDQEPQFESGAWIVRLGTGGAVDRVTEVTIDDAMGCGGWSYAAPDRLVGICVQGTGSIPTWSVQVLDGVGSLVRQTRLDEPAEYGFGEPLIDRANGQVYLWDAIGLTITRVDVASGAVVAATFDSAAEAAPGTADGPAGLPSWHDVGSAMQQSMWAQMAGSADGTRLFAVGLRQLSNSDFYGQASLGTFVIDRRTLALLDRWAPAANETAVAELRDGMVASAGQPGVNAAGEQVPWEGSITLRDATDGRILARYGRLSTDMAPVIVRP